MTKNPKFSKFQSFYAIFVKFSTDFVDWNVEKSQQGTNLLSSSLFRRDLVRKISRWSAGVLFKINSKHGMANPGRTSGCPRDYDELSCLIKIDNKHTPHKINFAKLEGGAEKSIDAYQRKKVMKTRLIKIK